MSSLVRVLLMTVIEVGEVRWLFQLLSQLIVRKDCQFDTGLLVARNVAFITGSADNLCLSHYGLNG